VAIFIYLCATFIAEYSLRLNKDAIFTENVNLAYELSRYSDIVKLTPDVRVLTQELLHRTVKPGDYVITETDRDAALKIAKYILSFSKRGIKDPAILLTVIARRLNELNDVTARALITTNGSIELIIQPHTQTENVVVFKFVSMESLF